jgi:UDP-2-acetamido-2-deoxy-ribo-hexuluronate aminotransferase
LDELLAAVARVLEHGQLILGPEVAELERRVAHLLRAHDAVGVASGTAALRVGLEIAGVGRGDEVIVPSHGFVATASAVVLAGATPVFADVCFETGSLDPEATENAITPRTKAVVPVHLSGIPVEIHAFSELCARRGLALVEDAAQAFGASLGGRMAGTFGLGCYSFHPLKVLAAAGDGGLLAVQSSEDAEAARRLRNLGLVDRGVAGVIADNARLDTIHAAMLLVKLAHFDAAVAARRAHAAAYRAALDGVFGLTREPEGAESVYSTFVVRHPRRDELVSAMARVGIDLKVHYPLPAHRQPPFAQYVRAPLPTTDRLVSQIVSLPVSPELDIAQRDEVIERLLEWARRSGGPHHG